MWSTLTVSDQEAAAQVLGDTLLAAGTPLEFRGLRAFTPFVPDATMDRPGERRVATFFDTRHQLDWVLVPGGTIGAWGDRELRLLRAAFEAMEAFRAEQRGPRRHRARTVEAESVEQSRASAHHQPSLIRTGARDAHMAFRANFGGRTP